MKNPCIDHWNIIIHILRYLKKAPRQGLLYEDKENTQTFGYCNADWVQSPMDRHSTTEYYSHWRKHYFSEKQETRCSCPI